LLEAFECGELLVGVRGRYGGLSVRVTVEKERRKSPKVSVGSTPDKQYDETKQKKDEIEPNQDIWGTASEDVNVEGGETKEGTHLSRFLG
jgi:hypothetical protein